MDVSCDRVLSCSSYESRLQDQLGPCPPYPKWKVTQLTLFFREFDKDGDGHIDMLEGQEGMIRHINTAFNSCVEEVEALPLSPEEAEDVIAGIERYLYGTRGHEGAEESSALARMHSIQKCVQHVWKRVDTDKDGKISFKEFAGASSESMDILHKIEISTPDMHKLYEQFVEMDSDNSGHVSKEASALNTSRNS